ncbi:MAG: type II toxin-antitoxin system RelE/ParE family toxin [Ginsengibacter sp.]
MKEYRVLISPEAENEFINAYRWYEATRPGLGKEFRKTLSIKIESIRKNPKYSTFVFANVRSTRLQKFPFNIIYRITNLQVQIIAVFHHSRNPYEWKARI